MVLCGCYLSVSTYYSLAVIRVCGYGGAISTGSFVRACSYGGVEVILITLFITWSRVSLLLSLAPLHFGEFPRSPGPGSLAHGHSGSFASFPETGGFLHETPFLSSQGLVYFESQPWSITTDRPLPIILRSRERDPAPSLCCSRPH